MSSLKHKQVRSSSPSLKSRLKKTKVGIKAPSRLGRPSVYWKMQADPAQRLLDDRPSPDVSVAPIALLYAGFGRFDDIVAGRTPLDTVVRNNSIKISNFDASTSVFVEAMPDKLEKDSDRQDEGFKHLNRILGAAPGLYRHRLSPAAITQDQSDVHSVNDDGQPLCVVK
jgi:hypothetical protein